MNRIAPDGWPIFLTSALLTFCAFSLGYRSIGAVLLIISLFILFFFRDPVRTIIQDPTLILSPADGTITAVKEVTFNNQPYHQIIIFLSVFNVHINRIPFTGQVVSTEHFPGLFLAAYRDNIEEKNERQETILETSLGKIKLVQITGAIARRIVCRLQPGQQVQSGEKFGLIKFGSRTDLYVPASSQVQILVQKGQKVQGGLTPLAKINR